MTDHSDDILGPGERDVPLEPRLAEAARAYNPPPATPREAMWARIAAARAEAQAQSPVAAPTIAPDTRVVSIDAARARRRPVRTWAILAGTLAAGIALGVFGRDLFRADGDTAPMVASGESTHVATPVDTGAGRRMVAENDAGSPLTGGPRPGTTGPVQPLRGAQGEQVASVRGGAEGPPPGSNIRRERGRTITPRTREEASPRQYRGSNGLYAAAAVQTLSRAEALLVAWRVDAPRDTAAARQLGTWARDVLGSTRLLLDSPAASDPQLRELLDDLELVLAQIVQLSGAPLTEEERALLDRSVRARDLLPRIRSVVPAGIAGAAAST